MPSVSNPLQQAVFRGCVECIRMLVETPPYYSVDVSCGPEGLRPIHIAAREGHIQTLRYLAAAGACLQRSDVNGATALHHAAISGQLRAVRWLLRHGAKILLDKRGRSPIQVAADHDHMEIVSVLAKHATCGTTAPATNTRDSNLNLSATNGNNNSTSNSNSNNNNNINSGATTTIAINHNNGNGNSISNTNTDTILPASNNNSSPTRNNNNSTNSNHHTSSSPTARTYIHHNHSLHLEDQEEQHEPSKGSPIAGGGDCASSSGNSSLTTNSTSTPSLSPSASSSSSSTASCSCSATSENSDEVTLKSVVEVSDSFTLEEFTSKTPTLNGRPGSANQSPFYLHPPKSPIANNSTNTLNSTSSTVSSGGGGPLTITTSNGGSPTVKKSNHKRQLSTGSSSPFFLHPPENLISETQKVVGQKMAPAPVNPSHGHLHVTELINESHTPKLKVVIQTGEISTTTSSASSSSCSPPPTPPSQKSPVSPAPSPVGKCQNGDINGNKLTPCENSPSNDLQIQTTNVNNVIKNVPPPPPPPPPMPNFPESNSNNNGTNHHAIYGIGILQELNGRIYSQPKTPDTDIMDDNLEGENDYEVIDEFPNGNQFNNNHYDYEKNKKLSRSVSAPPPPLEYMNGTHCDEKPGTPTVLSHIPKNVGTGMGGKPGVPFIPPHFPTPPQDALIKPSEYLRSIQQTQKPKYSNNNANANAGTLRSPRVEEAIKALGGVGDNHMGLMSPVPEETNVEDEFEEINPERINGGVNGDKVNNGNEHVPRDINHNILNNIHTMNMHNGHKGGGIIKAEDIMKVNLRKTPMSRTKSAPPLGRVVPDGEQNGVKGTLQNIPENGHSQSQQNGHITNNGHETVRKTNSVMNNNNLQNPEGATVSRAAVIAELAESSQVGGVREWKEELRRRQLEQEKVAQKELANYYQPVNFVAEVPNTDVSGAPIPAWKRQMMAKKAAERARKEAEEQRKMELEAKRMASIPMWRRQLLQRRESDATSSSSLIPIPT